MKIESFLGGNCKLFATVCGLGPANQDFACIWCLCLCKLRYNVSQNWSLTDLNQGARSIELIKEHVKNEKYNCMHTALFDFILLDHVLIDTLHLFLHISHVLIELLIRQLKCEDATEKKITFYNGFLPRKNSNTWTLMRNFSIQLALLLNGE